MSWLASWSQGPTYYLRKGQTLNLEQLPILQGYYHTIFYDAESVSLLVEVFLEYPRAPTEGQAVESCYDVEVPNA
jgi:hypothetical protein